MTLRTSEFHHLTTRELNKSLTHCYYNLKLCFIIIIFFIKISQFKETDLQFEN